MGETKKIEESSTTGSHPGDMNVERLSEAERAALETQFLRNAEQTANAVIRPRSGREPARLSSGQERFWFLERLSPGSGMYNVPWAYRLTGPLDVEAIQCAVDRILDRHTILRSTIVESPEGPRQVVAPSRRVPIEVQDLAGLPSGKREEALETALRDVVRRPFNLSSDPMLRTALFRLSSAEHVLVFVLHHIASDGWSRSIFTREFSQIYRAKSRGDSLTLPALPIQYADFAVWQRKRLRSDRLTADLAYWKEAFQVSPPDLRLPSENARPKALDSQGTQMRAVVPRALAERLRAFAGEEKSTLFMVLLTGFMTLLHRYTGETDLVVAAPIAGRLRPELESLIGLFVNTLALRGDLSGSPTFREALQRIRQTCLGAYDHQEAPFEEIVAQIPAQRDSAASPLVRVLMALQNMPGMVLEIDDVDVSPLPVDTGSSKFDLSLVLHEGMGDLEGFWEFKTGLLTPEAVERMGANLNCLLDAAIDDPDIPIDRLHLVAPREQRLVVEEWNRTERPYPRESTIHRRFEAVAAARPDAVALVCGSESVTYRELNARANRLAHALVEQGVGSGRCVGLCLERSLDLVVAILGILKAGGAYAPLDPSYPRDRLAFMLKDTQAEPVITSRALARELGPFAAPAFHLDGAWDSVHDHPSANLDWDGNADGLAYVMYTSGSTGSPKAVAVPHRGVLRLVVGTDYVELGADQTHLLLAPTSFDASTFELWGALLHGARCVIYPERIPTMHELAEVLRQHRVTVLWLTSTLFNLILDQSPEMLASVPQILTGGEALSLPHIRRALKILPHTRLINGYGPTESTTFACCYPIPRDLEETLGSVPIGRPIANTRVYIVDEHDQPVPVGVSGELLVGGDGLALGYLNRPELTEARFVADPFSNAAGGRVYRTGDRARFLSDGRIEYLGRRDDQVKVRGFRIELGEIESVLASHVSVGEAAVVLRNDWGKDPRLVAYVLPTENDGVDEPALRGFLKAKLPDHMIPSAIVSLDRFPLSPSGKVDRKRLPRPGMAEDADAGRPERKGAPRDTWTPTESGLAEIWEDVLGVGPVSLDDNFFDLGGHSLLALRVFAEIENRFRRFLPISLLFRFPTVRQLASVLDKEEMASPTCLVPIQSRGTKPPLFLVHAGGGHAFFYRDLARRLGRERPVFGLEAVGTRGTTPHERVEDMAAHYVDEIRRIQPRGPYRLGGSSFGGLVAFEMARLLAERGERANLVALFDTHIGALTPEKPARSRSIRSFRARFARVVGNLWRLPLRDKAFYARAKIDRGLLLLWLWWLRRLAPLLKRLPWGPEAGISLQLVDTRKGIRKAFRSYLPGMLRGTAVLFRASQQIRGFHEDPSLGWADRVDELRIHVVPGFHGDIVSEPAVGGLIGPLREELERCDQETA